MKNSLTDDDFIQWPQFIMSNRIFIVGKVLFL